jgi:ubiquinone biosynthesis protein
VTVVETAPPASRVAPAKHALVFEPMKPYRGLLRRFFTVHRHLLGLLFGGLHAYARSLPPERRRGLRSPITRLTAALVRPFLDRSLRDLPYPAQLRRRLELLGPTYIKFGQILAIREDILPDAVTRELANLFDRLPPIPFDQVRGIIERSLDAPCELLFRSIDPEPLGSASIAQAHRAETLEGHRAVVKVIKPGIADVIALDLRLLSIIAHLLEWVIPRYQPKQIIKEFSAYTIREVDYQFEADNAETFAANFARTPNIVFPKIYRHLSATDVLTMELIDGFKPGAPRTDALTPAERDRVIDLGAGAIVRMLYRDGFFHADLHAGNLMILPATETHPRVRIGFIDLGMVGRFEERTRRRMLFYFHALVSGDVENAARQLTAMARVGKGGDAEGFRRAVADLSRRFVARTQRGQISIAQLILESVGLGATYRVFFPVEMTLMVKALVTFEGVGRVLDPTLDVAKISRKHVTRIFRRQFDPKAVIRDVMRSAPELVDVAVRMPQLLTASVKFAEEALSQRSRPNPLAELRSGILAAACIVAGVIAVIQGAALPLWLGLFVLALVFTLSGK